MMTFPLAARMAVVAAGLSATLGCSFLLAPAVDPAQASANAERVTAQCQGIEMMGLYNVDMRPMSPLIVYQAKVRNGTQVARIVTLQWRDMYGQAMQSTVQVGAGEIATIELSRNGPSDRRPIELQFTSCQ